MNRRTPLLLLLILPLLLAGCVDENVKKDEKEDPFKIAADKVVKEGKARIEKNAKLGPIIPNRQQLSQQQKRRTFIGKEEKRNYLKVQQGDEADIFPVTIHFEGVEIHKGFEIFAELVDRNILVGDEVRGEITARLRNVPWDKALDAILNMKDLAKHVDHEANIIRIHQRSILSGQEAYDRQRAEALKQSLELSEALEPLYTEIFQLHYANPEKIKSELESVLGATSGGKGATITIDERTRALIVQSTRANLDLVEKLITRMDLRTEQVMIEAYIVEVKDSFKEEFGARLGTAYRHFDGSLRDFEIAGINSPTVVTDQSGGVSASTPEYETTFSTTGSNDIFDHLVSGAGIGLIHRTDLFDLKFQLSAMEEDGITNIISNPRVFTLNNSMATIEQGDQIPYKSTSDAGPVTEFKDAKVSLDVTPSIVGDGNLLLDLEVHKDSVEAQNAGSEPPITQRIIRTKLLVPDKSTVVIGGIYTQTKTEATVKVPLLGDLPVIGKLFRKETDNEEKKELLIFISPYII